MMATPRKTTDKVDHVEEKASGPAYSAPALEKGLDILEILCSSNIGLSQVEIAERLGRSVSEIYRMLACLVNRSYVANIGDSYSITTKLFELAHSNPPTNRLLSEAAPIMQELSSEVEQSCHLTVYNEGRQVVIAKVDNPTWVGFSIRVGAFLDVLVSASGRVLLAFQEPGIMDLRIRESLRQRPEHADLDIVSILEQIKERGYESIASMQVRGLHAISYPIFDTRNRALAALTVPYAERLDQPQGKTVAHVEMALGRSARALSERMGWREGTADVAALGITGMDPRGDTVPRRRRRIAKTS
jgi:DNA-binding IclR family transcriptional regulator